mmetsp:Transcript_20340/g.56376  ORF Transcript_20340/g.56376 Transcript_20340/m.56376 type:complete len:200 (+) Transcript_20340:1042-1641(+)
MLHERLHKGPLVSLVCALCGLQGIRCGRGRRCVSLGGLWLGGCCPGLGADARVQRGWRSGLLITGSGVPRGARHLLRPRRKLPHGLHRKVGRSQGIPRVRSPGNATTCPSGRIGSVGPVGMGVLLCVGCIASGSVRLKSPSGGDALHLRVCAVKLLYELLQLLVGLKKLHDVRLLWNRVAQKPAELHGAIRRREGSGKC